MKKRKSVNPSQKSLVSLSTEAFVKAFTQPHDAKAPEYTIDDFSHSTIQLILENVKTQSWPLATSTLFLRALNHYVIPQSDDFKEHTMGCSSAHDLCLWKIAYETFLHRYPLLPNIQGSSLRFSDLWYTAFIQSMIQRYLDFIEQRYVPGAPVKTKKFQSFISEMEEFFPTLPNCSIDLSVRRSGALSIISLNEVLRPKISGIDASETESDLEKAYVVPIIQFFPNLTCLCLRNVKLRHGGFSQLINSLCSSTASSTISTLNISNCSLGVANACTEITKLAGCCPNIKHLDISVNLLHDTGIAEVATAFSKSKALRTLDVTSCNCSSKGVSSLSTLLSGNLLRLYTGANKDLYSKSDFDAITEMFSAFGNCVAKRTTPVISLDMSGEEPITSARIAELNELRKGVPPSLQAIHVSGLLSSMKRMDLNGVSFSAIHKLTLDGVPLAQDAVNAITEAIARGGLSVLSVSGCCLSTESISSLFGVVSSGSCSVLNVSGNKPMAFPVESLLSALKSPTSELARLNISSCGVSDRQAQQIFSAMANCGKSVVSLIISANNLGPGCELGLCEMLSKNNTLTELDLSENNLSFAKLAGITQCSNQVLSKLDISYNPRAKASIIDFVCDNLHCLSHIRALRRSSGTSRLWSESIIKLLRTHPTIEDVVISCPTLQAIKQIAEFLCDDIDRENPLRMCINAGYDAALHVLKCVDQMNTLTELMLVCSQAYILELAKYAPQPCGTRVRLVPTYALDLGFPTWTQYPLPPYPLIYRNSVQETYYETESQPPEKRIKI